MFTTFTPLYAQSLRLIISQNVDKTAHRLGFDGDGYVALTLQRKGKLYIVLQRNASAGTIAHEAIHAAFEILEKVGVKVKYSNHESLTYLAGWIADWVEKKLRPKKKQP